MTAVYEFTFPSIDDTNPYNITIPNYGTQAITIPDNTRVQLVFDAMPGLAGLDPDLTGVSQEATGIEIGVDNFFFGPNIVRAKPILGEYSIAQVAQGFTLVTSGTSTLGAAIASIRLHPWLHYDTEVFVTGRMIVLGGLKGKQGYRRTRFSG